MNLRLTDPEWQMFEEIMCACQDVLDGHQRTVNVGTAKRAKAILAVGYYVRPLLLKVHWTAGESKIGEEIPE